MTAALAVSCNAKSSVTELPCGKLGQRYLMLRDYRTPVCPLALGHAEPCKWGKR